MSDTITNAPGLDDLCEQALARLRALLASGQSEVAESVLAEYPALASQAGYAVEIVLEEFRERRRAGESLAVEDFVGRFPALGSALRATLRIELLRGLAPDTDARQPITSVYQVAPASAPPLPALDDDYERLDGAGLGKGGMGMVYRGRHRVTGDLVAIKVMTNAFQASDAEQVRFRREITVMASLNHPGIVRVLAFGTFEKQPAYVMPVYPGGSVARRLGEYREPRRAAELVRAVARALGVAHAAGVVHRDLKPGNVLLTVAGEPVVADFGLARVVGGDGHELTRSNQVMGTPDYMSPEVLGGQAKRVGPASDVYSLGVFLHVLLTGQKPFAEEPSSGDPPEARVPLPAGLNRVVATCLAFDPQARYPDADALAEDLERWLAGRRVRGCGGAPGWWLPATAVGLAGVLALVILVLAAQPQTQPAPVESSTQATLTRLQAGEPVDLVGPLGGPGWVRDALNPGAALPPVSAAHPYGIESWSPLALELLPEAPADGFRLSAEVLSWDKAREVVGLYALADTPTGPEDRELRACVLTLGGRPREVRLFLTRLRSRALQTSDEHELARRWPSLFPAASLPGLLALAPDTSGLAVALEPLARPGPRWHRLELTVTPAGVEAAVDGVRQVRLPRGQFDPQTRLWWQASDPEGVLTPPAFRPAGAVGLIVSGGACQVRNVRITPLRAGPDAERKSQ